MADVATKENEQRIGCCNKERARKEPPALAEVATYLLHLVQRGLVNAKLLKVILRGRNHLVDDQLVDRALLSLLAQLAFTRPLPSCEAGTY